MRRTQAVSAVLSDDERQALEMLATTEGGLLYSQVIRHLIRQAAADYGFWPPSEHPEVVAVNHHHIALDEAIDIPDDWLAKQVENKSAIDVLLEDLPARERRIVVLRFGLEGYSAHTLEEVGKKFHFTRERVRQLEQMALRRMRGRIQREKIDICP
jgi:RNA polymerase sigma factor (sigma-70 family)